MTTVDELAASVLARIMQARDEANAAPEMMWARIYATALEDIAGLVGVPKRT